MLFSGAFVGISNSCKLSALAAEVFALFQHIVFRGVFGRLPATSKGFLSPMGHDPQNRLGWVLGVPDDSVEVFLASPHEKKLRLRVLQC